MSNITPTPVVKLAKRPRIAQRVPDACPACHAEKRFVTHTATGDFVYRGSTVRVAYDCLSCPDCGFAVLDDGQLEARHRRVREQATAQP